MRNFLTIWRRELTACFLSPVAYVTMVVYLAVCGGTFLLGVERNVGTSQPVSSLLFAAVITWMTVLVAVISMRLFAEEKRQGTLETLMTAPVTETEVVMGKYAGALTFLLVVSVPAISNIYLLAAFNHGLGSVDNGAVAGGCIVLFLISAFLVSIGLIISLMTRSQLIAAICVFCAVWIVLLMGNIVALMPGGSGKIFDFISLVTHIEDFSRGAVDTRPVVLYVTSTALMLFTAVKMLESRRWK